MGPPVQRISSPISGLIFDLDGVLISSSDCHRRAFEEEFARAGVYDFCYRQFSGWRTVDVFRTIFREKNMTVTEKMLGECAGRKSARARELLAAQVSVASDCVPVLRELAVRYRLALATSGSRETVRMFLDQTSLEPCFRSVLVGDDVQHAKPAPEIFSRSINALGLKPEECLVIEDAVAGVQAARSAGARVIGFGNEHAAELYAAGAEQIVNSLTELAGVLGKL
jgi:HAD superfamily hydrolase (TIGR01509 family)